MKYNYYEAMHDNIREYIEDNYTEEEIFEGLRCPDEWNEKLYDELWVVDSVTGNASGSYTFSTWKAEENICHNLDLLAEAMEEFCCEENAFAKGAEWCDVTIRCYLLGEVLGQVLEELETEYFLTW